MVTKKKVSAIFLLLTWTKYCSCQVKVFSFQPQLIRSLSYPSYASLVDPPLDIDLKDMTMCMRLQLYLKYYNRVYVSRNLNPPPGVESLNIIKMSILAGEKCVVWISFAGFHFPVLVCMWPLRWHHFCFSFRNSERHIAFVFNGAITGVNETIPMERDEEQLRDLFRFLMLGRTARDSDYSYFAGEMSDVNFWGRAMSIKEMIDWTLCRNDEQGDIVSWRDQEWNLTNVFVKTADRRDMCVDPDPAMTLINVPMDKGKHALTCAAFGGMMPSPDTPERNEEIKTRFQTRPAECKDKVWLGMNDLEVEGRFVFEETDQPVSNYSNWNKAEPNGKTLSNCVRMYDTGYWDDYGCEGSICSFCDFPKIPKISIRGLCKKSRYDNLYTWIGTKDFWHTFRGLEKSEIVRRRNRWEISSISDNTTYGFNNNSLNYPFGLLDWYFPNGSCHDSDAYEVRKLLLNGCTHDEFSCNIGTCVPLSKRCDVKEDCEDGSDEEECKIIEIKRSYKKDYPPPPLAKSDRFSEVVIDIDVLSVLGIREIDMAIKIQFTLFVTWYDPRLTFYNLKKISHLNTLTFEEMNTVYVPILLMLNTDKQSTSFVDKDSLITVERFGKARKSDLELYKADNIFKGKENPLTYQRTYDVDFHCQYKMNFYPFDIQKCSMIFTMNGNTNLFVKMKRGMLRYVGPRELVQFYVTHWEMIKNSNNYNQTVEVRITLKRQYFFHLATTFLPTTCLIIITYLTYHFSIDYFDTRVMVTLTSMLVMTSLFDSLSSTLPTTSYVKIIDLWMIFGMTMPFFVLLLHTIVEYYHKYHMNSSDGSGIVHVAPVSDLPDGKEKYKYDYPDKFQRYFEVLNSLGKNSTFFLIVMFNTGFWILVLSHYYITTDDEMP